MAENSKMPSKKTGTLIAIITAILIIIAVAGTAVFIKTRGNAEATEVEGSQTSNNSGNTENVANGNENTQNDEQTQNNEQSEIDEQNTNQTNTQNSNGARANNEGTQNSSNSQTQITTQTTNGQSVTTNAGTIANGQTTQNGVNSNTTTGNNAQNGTTNNGVTTIDNIQGTEIIDTQINRYEEGIDGRYLSWEQNNVDTNKVVGIAEKLNVKLDDITISKKADKEKVKLGEELTYTITVSSNKELNEIEIKDKVPTNTKLNKDSISKGTEIVKDNNGNTWIRCNVNLSKENEYKAEVKFAVTVDESATGEIINAEAIANGKQIDNPVSTPLLSIIKFEENGGEEVDDIEIQSEKELEDRTMPTTTKQGYSFDGWYDNEKLSGNEVKELLNKYPAGTTTYYAKWSPKTDTKYTMEQQHQNLEQEQMQLQQEQDTHLQDGTQK